MTLLGEMPRRSAGPLSVALVAVAAMLFPLPTTAAFRPADGDLSPRLADLAKPGVRSASPAEQAERLSVAEEGPGSLLRDGNRLLVDVRFERGGMPSVNALSRAGAEIINVSRRYQTVTVGVRPGDLRKLATVSGAASVTETLAPMTFSSEEPPPTTLAGPACPSSGATSEGDSQLRASEAREIFEVEGNGATVGVLSDSFDRDSGADTSAEEDEIGGDLPGPANPCGYTDPVIVIDDSETDGADEGRAMAQIVHDLAPGSEIAFATAFSGITGFADNIRKLADPIASSGAEADTIVDDVVYFEEPFFQDGPVAVAVNDVTSKGVAYFSSAGNSNLFNGGNEVGSWEAEEFRDVSSCPVALEELLGEVAEVCMDFNPGPGTDNAFAITIKKGGTLSVDLQWAEPWYGVDADLDVYLLDSEGDPIEDAGGLVGSLEDNPEGSKKPFEFFHWENETGAAQQVHLVINRCFATCNPAASPVAAPRLKFVLFQNGVTATEYTTSTGGDVLGPTIFGHNGAWNTISVGAVRYDNSLAPEPFSSRGPVTHRFGPISGTTPAPPLGAPQILSKPDLVATDGGANTFFGQLVEGVRRFFGTSAAAPHAAAVSALMHEQDPTAEPSEIRNALWDGAAAVGGFSPCAVGAGIVDAVDAINHLLSSGAGGGSPACTPPVSTAAQEGDGDPSSPPAVTPQAPTPAASVLPPVASQVSPTQLRIAFRRRPRRIVRTRWRSAKVVFRFAPNVAGVRFFCKVNRRRARRCPRRFARRFGVGRHVLRVTARDTAGNFDLTPAVWRFRVRRIGR